MKAWFVVILFQKLDMEKNIVFAEHLIVKSGLSVCATKEEAIENFFEKNYSCDQEKFEVLSLQATEFAEYDILEVLKMIRNE